jgi:hypothetical protein
MWMTARPFDYCKGKCTHVEIEWNDTQRRINLGLKTGSRMLPQAKRHIQARVVGEEAHKGSFLRAVPYPQALGALQVFGSNLDGENGTDFMRNRVPITTSNRPAEEGGGRRGAS